MALLDAITETDTPTTGGTEPSRTFTAPRPAPVPEHVPPFLRGIKPVTSKMLEDSWAAKAKKEQPTSFDKPGDLITRIASSSQKLTDVMAEFTKYNPRNPQSPVSRIMREGKAYDLTLSGEAPDMESARGAVKNESAASISEGPQARQEQKNSVQDAILGAIGNAIPGPGGLLAKLSSVSDVGKVPLNVAVQGADTFNILESAAPDTYQKLRDITEPQTEAGKQVAGFAGGAAKVIPELLLLKKAMEPGLEGMSEEAQGGALFGTQSLVSGVAPVIAGKETAGDVLKESVSSTLLGAAFPGVTGAAKTEAESLLADAPQLVKRTGEAGAEALGAGALGAGQTTLDALVNNKDISTEDQAKAALNLGLFAGISNIAGGGGKANKIVEAPKVDGLISAIGKAEGWGVGRDTGGNLRMEKYNSKTIAPFGLLGDTKNNPDLAQDPQKVYEFMLRKLTDPKSATYVRGLVKEDGSINMNRLVALRNKWAPLGAGNDPHDLNSNWLASVEKHLGSSEVTDTEAPAANRSTTTPEPVHQAPAMAQDIPLAPIEPAPEAIKAQIDAQAHEAATSPTNDLPEPTPLQVQSGNYKKGHVDVAGFDISVENPAGSVRRGISSDGTPWETEMKDHYGYIKGSTGADGDHLDAFIGPDPASEKVFVVDQIRSEDENKPFDEHKVILGARSAEDARDIYKRNFSDNAEPRIAAITETTPGDLKDWMKSGNTREAFAESDIAKRPPLPEPLQRAYGSSPIKQGEDNAITERSDRGRDLSQYQDGRSGGQAAQSGSGDSPAYGASPGETEIPQANGQGESQKQGNGQPLPEEILRQPLTVHGLGEETAIELTGKTPLKARYAVVEADDLQASHNEETFSPNPHYPERTQTRDYSGTKEEQAKVIGNAENFKPQYIVTDDPSPVNGPPIVDASGTVAGGNGRTMTIKRVYNNNPQAAQAFKDLQIKKAQNFGIDPEAVRALEKPVIIRQLDESDVRGAGGSKLVDDLNDTPTQQSDALTQGVTTGRRMSPQDVTDIASALQDGSSIRDALSSKASTDRVREVLRRNGSITRVNAPRYLKSDGTFTPEGVNLIEGAMMGRVIDDVGTAKIIQGLGGNYAKKITEALHPLSVIEGAPKEWSLKPKLDKVMRYIAARGDMADVDFRSQPAMFEGQDISLDPGERAILAALDDAKIKTFKSFAKDYAERIGGDIFHPNTTPEEALAETVKVFGGSSGAGTLSSEIFPGAGMVAKSFEATYEQDVKPVLINAAKGVIEAAQDIQKIFAPATRGESAKETKLIMRERMASLARTREIAETAMEESRKALEKLPQAAKYEFIDRNERGLEQGTPELEAISKSIAPIFESRIEKVHAIAPGKLKDLIDNYFPHIWEDPKKARNVFSQIYSKRPLEGSKAFLKQRVHEYFSDGIAAGLKPVSDNPIDLILLKAHEVDRFIMAHETLNEMKERGLLKYVSANERAPDGYVKIDDKVSTVYGNPNIPVWESHDLHIMGKLNTIAESLGIDNERKPNIGGSRMGYAVDSDPTKVVTKFGGSERTLAHEIGHALDFKYGLKQKLVRNKEFKQELRDLADKRLENGVSQKYVRKGEEKMAVMLESYIWAPEIFKSTAPKTYTWFNDFLSTHPELKPLTEIKPSLTALDNTSTVNAGGLVIRGNYWAPEEAARIVNNYLSPGLREKSAVFRGYLGLGNLLNQAQLGLSAFHLGFVTIDSITSGLALGIYKGAKGHFIEGAKTAGSAAAAPFTNIILGSKVLKEWSRPGSQGEEIGLITDALEAGGGRARMDAFYHTSVAENMVKAFKSANYFGAFFRIPFAAIEITAKPIMEHLVPRMKLGAFANMARFELERNQAELASMSPADRSRRVRELMDNAWDSVDNRLGQLVYDNLFWHKATKDLAMASVRSVGWNIGTFRELGGGLIDYGKAIKLITSGHYKDAEFTHRMSYVIAAPIMAGMIGGTLNYLMTGELPIELKDYFFPRTGGKDEEGNDARAALPSYMKDVFAYQNDIHDAIALKQPLSAFRTILHKAHPAIGMISEMLQNKDYYGAKIVGDQDNFLLKFAEHGGKQFIPFAGRGILRNIENEGMSWKALAPFIGVTPAPKDLNQSDASKLMQKYLSDAKEQGGFERSEHSDIREKAIHAFRTGKQAEGRKIMIEGIRSGVLTSFTSKSGVREGEHVNDDVAKILKESKMSYMQAKFKEKMDLPKAMNIYEIATPAERRQLRSLLLEKWHNKTKEGANTTQKEIARLRERFMQVRNLPVK